MKNKALCSLFVLAMTVNAFAQVDNAKDKVVSPTTKGNVKKANEKSEVFIVVYPNEPAKRYYFYLYDFDFRIEDQDTDSSGYAITYDFPEFEEAEVVIPNKHCLRFLWRKQKRLQSRSSITKDELPSLIMDSFKKSFYKDWMIEEEREMIQFSEPGIKLYSIRIRKGDFRHVLYYAEENGRLLQVKKVKNAE